MSVLQMTRTLMALKLGNINYTCFSVTEMALNASLKLIKYLGITLMTN